MKLSVIYSIFAALSLIEATPFKGFLSEEFQQEAIANSIAHENIDNYDGTLGQDSTRFYASSKPTLDQLWGEDWPFTGIATFAHMNHSKCLINPDLNYDIGIIGVPFDTATTYRPGARFGPKAIRQASQRQTFLRGFNHRAKFNPYQSWASFIDCGDIPITPMDNELGLEQMTQAFEELLFRRKSVSDNNHPPRYVALGGDHSVLLPHVRALNKLYGKIAVIHFDAHLDTWKPSKYPAFWSSPQSKFTHGSMLWMANEEGLISDDYNVHIGLRTRLSGTSFEDYDDDTEQGWLQIEADDVWLNGGMKEILSKTLKRIPKDFPVYISVDIDCLDPGFAPGTGTIEPGGLLPRELIHLLRGLEGLNLVGADIVEVSPMYDHAEVTATNAAQVVYELITSMVKKGQPLPVKEESLHLLS